MVATTDRTVTVFGGTGFPGRRIVRHLRSHGFPVRTASRHPDRGHRLFGPDNPQLQSVGANIHDERSVADALGGAYGVVNAVSLYVEHGQETFHSVHVEAAQRVAAQALCAGVDRLIHISGIGADAASLSRYIRKRGGGELAVRATFSDALFVRPAVMFGPDDAFLTAILGLLRQLPIYPMFGRGLTRLQPAYVEDVAEAIGRTLQASGNAFNDLRVRRPARLLLRGVAWSHCAPSWTCAPTDSNPFCRLECPRMGLRNTPKPAPHTQSSGTDANRHRVIAGDAWIC
jgi:uncharacterized protein YbjT (DUF2867 family)